MLSEEMQNRINEFHSIFRNKNLPIRIGKFSIEFSEFTGGDLPAYFFNRYFPRRFTPYEEYLLLVEEDLIHEDNKVWMSTTEQETVCCEVPCTYAEGRVGVAGLGLGFYLYLIMQKDSVEKITVFEICGDLICIWKDIFKDVPGFNKINFVQGDLFEKAKGYTFDLFYNDIYKDMLTENVFEDFKKLKESNSIKRYRFWGQEVALLSLLTLQTTLHPEASSIEDCIPGLRSRYAEDFLFIQDMFNRYLRVGLVPVLNDTDLPPRYLNKLADYLVGSIPEEFKINKEVA